VIYDVHTRALYKIAFLVNIFAYFQFMHSRLVYYTGIDDVFATAIVLA